MDNTVYFNPEWMEALSFIKEESRNMLISAIITYQVTGVMPDLPAGKAIFMFMKLEVDHRAKRLADAREKRARRKKIENPSSEKLKEESSTTALPSSSQEKSKASAQNINETPNAQPSHSDSSQKNPSQEPKIVKDTVNATNNPTTPITSETQILSNTPITPLPQPIKNMAG